MKKAIYSGTFDPFTIGHIDIVKKASKIFDQIIIAVALSSAKKPMFDIHTRVEIIQNSLLDITDCEIVIKSFDNLLVDFAKQESVENIIRGVRTNIDFEYELQMSYANSSLNSDLNTILLISDIKNSFVSSSLVRELIKFDGDVSHLLSGKVTKKGLIKKN
jgi:pantetheine-phosphate adenylyltransferase